MKIISKQCGFDNKRWFITIFNNSDSMAFIYFEKSWMSNLQENSLRSSANNYCFLFSIEIADCLLFKPSTIPLVVIKWNIFSILFSTYFTLKYFINNKFRHAQSYFDYTKLWGYVRISVANWKKFFYGTFAHYMDLYRKKLTLSRGFSNTKHNWRFFYGIPDRQL